ncbi:hypothetical protein [Gloeobacter kilaueensis]|uniref:Uncharacterized protein n=1 Tax=Gloeobacter kilaueensis (strain ATCC BAA-2537 / CCAP 1431/1 / ULC 316 / JS1) TaxID=1183438 RepID=U5QNJ2_GLOK1|nr:hypothetical protein [Gloeobacter kilaueensis]AGY60557.1 hypothetical protein GKIL_4311 [Gloeobacter kilaueensis JS1]
MLSQIVRPMVHTQIRLLASSEAPRSTLMNLLAQWLGFIGVRAQITHLEPDTSRIHIAFCVEKPEACDLYDWQHILGKLRSAPTESPTGTAQLSAFQERQLHRLLAHMIQVGNPDPTPPWEHLRPQLVSLGFAESTLTGIRACLAEPQPLDEILAHLEPDVAALALARAVGIAMLDRQINASEDSALKALLRTMSRSH